MRGTYGLIALSYLLLTGATLDAGAKDRVDFRQQVRPILSDQCFLCHGPDHETRMVGLRLDTREGAFGKRPAGAPIVPGDPQKSLVFQRITNENKALRMPPVYSHKTLTGEQIEVIRKWIEQGAEWSEHWAFAAPARPAPPPVKRKEWVRNPLDNFILARLEAEGLTPAPEADKRTLIRRVTLDLTGLPPDPRDVEAFVNNPSPDAYERWVDRLLNSAAYGEHRARYWLDAARYADTHGLHIDNYREMWPYRDWVINAFNQNMPFDRFTTEQLAGDLMENPTREQIIASGFHRCNITTNEGGVIDAEVAAMYAKDRADTTGAVWLGLTVGCATCHDHKFDPIKQSEFYSLTAFFRNTTQHPRDGNIYDTPPVLVVPSAADAQRWDELQALLPAEESKLKESRARALGKVEAWLATRAYAEVNTARFDQSEMFTLDLAGKPRVRMEQSTAALNVPNGVSVKRGPEKGTRGLRFDAKDTLVEVPGFQQISGSQPFTIALRFFHSEEGGRMLLSQSEPKDDDRGWWLEMADDRPRFSFTGDGGTQLGVYPPEDHKLEKNQWHHVIVSYDGHRQRSGISIYVDGEPVATEPFGRALRELEGEIRTSEPLRIGGRLNEDGKVSDFLGGAIAELRILNRRVGDEEARLLANWGALEQSRRRKPGKLTAPQREAVDAYYLARVDSEFQAESRQLDALRAERLAIDRRSPITHVMQEIAGSEPKAHILFRGMYDQPREEVRAGVPGVLPAMADNLPRNRTGLAAWLMSDTNPLTSRVTVNRFWQQVFGTGIVATAEDFGSQGTPPTHPELLDWLAVEFRESGWDVREFFRLLVTSATYRQSAQTTPEKLEQDPNNLLLSRGPRFRMDGEMVRDYALSASGLLVSKIGGPSVKPYQPEGLWETVAMKESNTRFFHRGSGEDLYRRSLYTFWKRSAPPPSLEIFNAPTRESCTVRRERTNTPLQALVTMNDPQFFEAARKLAGRAMQSSRELDGRIDFMAARLLSRSLVNNERSIVQAAYKDFLVFYDSHPEQAKRVLAVGESPFDPNAGKAEFAALTMVANQLMNLDEVLNK